jgi:phage/plasmid-like protein (TIGR03299 family)
MAHELNYNKAKGTYSFAAANEPAWHGLGQIVKGMMTAEEAIKNANLDYEVQKAKVSFTSKDQILNDVEGYYATYRTDDNSYLGMVKSRYSVVQNKDAFAFFDSLISADEAVFESAGALGRGERIFLLAKLPDDIKVGGEVIDKYILLMNSHDGSSSVIAGMTNIRVVCNNTLQAALGGLENRISISHTSTANERLKEAYKVMKLESDYSKQVGDMFNRMTDVKMSSDEYIKFFEKVYTPEYSKVPLTEEEKNDMSTRTKNMIDVTFQFSQVHPTQQTSEATNTLWGAYNAVSGYYNYIKDYKSPEDKFKSHFLGMSQKKIMKAFQESLLIMGN